MVKHTPPGCAGLASSTREITLARRHSSSSAVRAAAVHAVLLAQAFPTQLPRRNLEFSPSCFVSHLRVDSSATNTSPPKEPTDCKQDDKEKVNGETQNDAFAQSLIATAMGFVRNLYAPPTCTTNFLYQDLPAFTAPRLPADFYEAAAALLLELILLALATLRLLAVVYVLKAQI
ncbi:hypothetical protein Anapl_02342 [Anas platyrhynchos]|uniref:Uncharacterized protein n=1 Tax=Anas platyrhynchos TaxID=8839 RepID=R0JUK9_ANAPL|nr:hypothetical protein Anapl_02342 [Anas platyrhynchos]